MKEEEDNPQGGEKMHTSLSRTAFCVCWSYLTSARDSS